MVQTTLRNSDLSELVDVLRDQKARQLDIVAPATAFRNEGALLRVSGAEPIIDENGVGQADGMYYPTSVCDEGIADKLGIPLAYMRKMRAERDDILDANINGWLHGHTFQYGETAPADNRNFLLRCFRGDEDTIGVARAFLSDSYRTIDNFDVLMACLDAVRTTDADVTVGRVNLTERRMFVRFISPSVRTTAERLLSGYRNPFAGEELERWRRLAEREGLGYSGHEPIVHAGWDLANSETGDGAYTLTPVVVAQVCANGAKATFDMVRSVHLGGKLSEGVVKWSDETQKKNLELVRLKTIDAVKTFLDVDYLESLVAKFEKRAEEPVENEKQVRDVTKAAGYTKAQQDGILAYFVRGGQTTRGGVFNAITAYAQTVSSPDEAYDLETNATRVLV